MAASSGDKDVKNERGGKYDASMVTLFLILFNDSGFLLLTFDAIVKKIWLLMQAKVILVTKLTALSGNDKIKNKQGSKDDKVMVPLLMLLLWASILLLILLAAAFKE